MMKTLREIYEKLNVKLLKILYSEKGQTLVEYSLLLVLIAIFLIMIVRGTGQTTNCIWSRINSGLY
jgi:Flp pilus assembly pilin Flp